jgi:DNA-binding SARP family transcriptional activator
MPRLLIALFGSFQVTLDGRPVAGFTSKKSQALLTFLTVEAERPHRREELAGLLWPDYPEPSARTNLRSVLADLRRVIGDHDASPPFLKISRETIQFNQASNYDLDVTTFTRLLAQGVSAPLTIEAMEEAAALYQGPFLAGFSLPDSPLFEEWALLKRELLARRASETLHHLAGYYEQQGGYEQALAHARRWLELDPWQEEAHQQVMRVLALSGRRSEALAQYESCRRLLAEELGVEPADETTNLYEQIRAGKLKGEAGQQRDRASPRHNLPLALTPLIGREVELADLARLLANPELRLLTLVGPGGVGKSRLALEAAASQGQHYRDGVYLVSLASLRSVDTLASTIAEAVRFSFYGNSPPQQQLLDYLRHKQMLLVMDNFEHVLDGVGLIVDILHTAPALKFLTTSRTRLNVQGEQLYPLAGLSYPDETALAKIPASNDGWRYGAMVLFEYSARRLRPDFALTNTNLADVVRICRQVRGMPLGLLLASAWVELLNPGEIAAEIEWGFDFLRADWRDLPERQRSLRAVFEHSWTLLRPQEQAIFQQLSIFRGSFSREAAQAVTGATLTDLLALVNKFLLHRPPTGRYEVHELLRQFAAEKLARSPAVEETAHRRHSAFYVAFLGQREADLKGARQKETLAEIEAEGENIRAAWDWAVEQRQIEPLDQALNGLGYFYEWRGRYPEGETAYRLAAEMLKRVESGQGVRLLVKTLMWQGRFNRLLGNADLAAQLARQSLSLLDSPALAGQDTRPEQAATLLEIGQQTTNLVEARRWFEQGLTLYRSLDDPWGTAQALYLLGYQLILQPGSYDEGQQLLEESRQLCQTLGDQRGIAEVLERMGFMMMLRGQAETGEALLRQSLAICREMDDKATTVGTLSFLSTGFIFHGRFTEARDIAEEQMKLSQDLGSRPMIARSLVRLADANLYLGRYGRARSQGQMCLKLCREIDDPYMGSYALWQLGDVALAEAAYAEAEQLQQDSVSMHQEMGRRSRLQDVLLSLGLTACSLGKLSQARQCLADALRTALENRFFLTRPRAICLAALLSIKEEKLEQAVEFYALASRYPLVANSRWYEDVIGRHIAAAAAALPPETVKAAQERGRTRDLEATVQELLQGLEGV